MRMLNVLVVSRSQIAVNSLAACLSTQPNYRVKTRVIANGHEDPLYGQAELPDLLLLHYGPGSGELAYLAQSGTREQLPLIVCGPVSDPNAMRLAMQAGARDYLADDTSESDLLASVAKVHDETQRARSSDTAKLVVMVNGKGGSGASFLATNFAHSLVLNSDARVTLVDLDLQFGGLYRYLDVTPKVGLLQALEAAHELDDVSAKAFTCEHPSGLRLLAAPSRFLTMANSISIDRLETVMDAYLRLNDYVVADAPAHLDAVTELWFSRADHIMLVTQQSLPHIQDCARQMQLLISDFGIAKRRISVVVNRWSKNAEINSDDIRKALRVERIHTIPNNYKIANECINAGILVSDVSKSAALTKSIAKLQGILMESSDKPNPGFLKRVMPNFLGG